MCLAIEAQICGHRIASTAYTYLISPDYLHAEGTKLLAGRTFTWHDDKAAPRVAVVNRQFAKKIFGSVTNAIGGYYKMPDGTRIQVVGIAEDGKYGGLSEDPKLATASDPAVPLQLRMAGGALEPRSTANGSSHKAHPKPIGCRAAGCD